MKTLFVTGGTGFIGAAFVRRALAVGYQVKLLTRAPEAVRRLEALGAVPVVGDLLEPGPWREVVADCECVMHLAQPQTFGGRVSLARALAYRERRLRMDTLLLDSLRPGTVRRFVYVGGTSYIGDQGTELKDETATPNPKGWGPYVAPAIEAVQGYVARGLPIVEAFPGAVYGPGSWFAEYTLAPLKSGKRLVGMGGPRRYTSPIHLEDCARALLHLLEHGEVGRRYFLVDDRPATFAEIAQLAARALGVPLRTRILPAWLVRLMIGPVRADSLLSGYRLSNARLKSTGFTFEFPRIDEGIPDAVRRWQAGER